MGNHSAAARYTFGEELANSLTHGFGLLLSIAGLYGLMFVASGVRETASCLVYGITLILVYATSTLYHGACRADAKQLLRTLDHVAIFLLIAGTYTPFVLIAMRGAWGWSLFVAVWTLAAVGAV